MTTGEFEIVPTYVRDTGEAPRAADIYYRCTNCGDAIPSQPCDGVG